MAAAVENLEMELGSKEGSSMQAGIAEDTEEIGPARRHIATSTTCADGGKMGEEIGREQATSGNLKVKMGMFYLQGGWQPECATTRFPTRANPGPGKAFAVFDPSVINTTEGMPNKRMQQLVRNVVKKRPLSPVYLNKQPNDWNSDGRCLQRALLHMLDLINRGEQFLANIERGADEKVAVVEGYRPVSV
ncbi:hypothetical protein GGX14DRAFT_397857 [Mycena pura]|uniref:Uncharacterized protein n=1 Tax=Mycena pura TaxID=153505 RepID=A0AAD6Y702_9AGAR|nr:hypothetical protein GGX14DRAFT_397857 [Mycena pura]